MKIVRYLTPSGASEYGAVQIDGSVLCLEGNIFEDFRVTQRKAEVAKILAPLMPTMIWCIGLNYRRHAAETGAPIPEFPVVFAKGPNCVQNPNDPVQIPCHMASDAIDHESELAVVIGKKCKNASVDNALDYVLGYTCANDVSSRDWQLAKGGTQWCRGKSFDTFAPLGPYLVTTDEIQDPGCLRIQGSVNGKIVQDSNTADMIFPVAELIKFLSGSTTLLPGTVILTGTPQGVGMAEKPPRWLRPGDTFSVTIDGIGTLTNPFQYEQVRRQTDNLERSASTQSV